MFHFILYINVCAAFSFTLPDRQGRETAGRGFIMKN